MITFGERDYSLTYWKRVCSYAVIQNEARHFLCVQDSNNYLFLVGGRIEEGETPEQALYRESIEETGYKLNIVKPIGVTEKHWVSSKYAEFSQHNVAHMYVCELLEKIAEPIEKEPMVWVDYNKLQERLYHKHQFYLINEYLKMISYSSE